MATARITVASEPTVYHVITRVTRGEFLFGEVEKERLRKMLWQMADFTGVEVLTYVVMSNHVHLVCRVPVKELADVAVENAEVLRRFGVLYGAEAMNEAKRNLDNIPPAAGGGKEDAVGPEKPGAELPEAKPVMPAEWATFRGKYVPLMHDLSWFVRLLKQRFARWYNAFHKTFGTLWAERFTSVIVEGTGEALLATCAYVDLNPVRAKMVDDPKDYRYSGYGEAVGGKSLARRGLESALGMARLDWRGTQARYRRCLYAAGSVAKVKGGKRQGQISTPAAEVVREQDGQLPWKVALASRVRFFTRSGIFGTKEFVERIFELKRKHFPEQRKSGARKLRGAEWTGLAAVRDLRM